MKNNMRVLLAKRREKVSHVAEATGISKSTLTALYYERTNKRDYRGMCWSTAPHCNAPIKKSQGAI